MKLSRIKEPKKTRFEIATIWLDILTDSYIADGLRIPLDKVKELRAIKDKKEVTAKEVSVT